MTQIVTPAGRRQSGFTLLEVLIALVVLGFLMVGLTAGVRAGLSFRQAQTQRLERTSDLDVVMRVLRGLLTALPVLPDGTRLIATGPGASFTGEANHVSFVGRMPSGLGPDRLVAMTIEVRNGGLVLLWSLYRHEHSFAPPPQPEQTELLQGVKRLDLAYWGPPAPNQPAGWQSRWVAAQAPELIRLRLVFAPDDRRRQWPELIVAPRI